MKLRLQRVKSVADWDRLRCGAVGDYYWIAAFIARGWSYEFWIVR